MKFRPLTLRQQIHDALKKEILERYQPGDFLPGERSLAQRFEVSVLTIREALQGLADLHLIERQQGVGTRILSADKTRASLPVGIVVEIDVSHPNASPTYLVHAMRLKREMERRGHETRLFFGSLVPGEVADDLSCPDFHRALENEGLKGVLAVSSTSIPWRLRCEARQVPVVCFSDVSSWGVKFDQSDFIHRAFADLMEQGCRHPAILTWDGFHDKNSPERSEIFREEVVRAGLEVHEKWIASKISPALSGAGWEAMRDIWRADAKRPDGLIITDDMLLRGALLALNEMRIQVPAELKIVSLVLPEQVATGTMTIATYEIPLDDIVDSMVGMMEERLTDPRATGRNVRFVARKGCSAPLNPLPSSPVNLSETV